VNQRIALLIPDRVGSLSDAGVRRGCDFQAKPALIGCPDPHPARRSGQAAAPDDIFWSDDLRAEKFWKQKNQNRIRQMGGKRILRWRPLL